MRFAAGVIDQSDHGVIQFSTSLVTDEEVESELQSLQVHGFETICDGWRNMDPEEEVRDVNGVPLVTPLVDFGDVYVVRYSASADPVEVSQDLEALDGVVYADPNGYVEGLSCTCPTGSEVIGDRFFPSTADTSGQWGLSNPGVYEDDSVTATEDIDINLPEAWKIHAEAVEKTRVGVIDIGFDLDHEDLVGSFDLADSACFGDDPCNADGGDRSHGTAVAAIIGAKTNNGGTGCEDDSTCTGVAGILGHPDSPDDLVVPIRVSGIPNTRAEHLADAICYASDSLGLSVANMSLVVTEQTGETFVRDALRNAYALGTLPVAAGGNIQAHAGRSPQRYDRFVFGVGSIGADGTHQSPHAEGRHIDVVAPAENTNTAPDAGSWSAEEDDSYDNFGGTSGAAPHVSGSAALVLSYADDLTNEDLIEVIARRARNIEVTGELSSGYDETFGFGLVRLDSTFCWLTENEVGHGSTTAWDDSSSTVGVRAFRDLPNDSASEGTFQNYHTRVYRLQRDVTFDDYTGTGPLAEENVWARGRQCSGWRDTLDVDVREDLNWAGVDGGSVSSDGCTLSSYFYQIFDDSTMTTVKQWFPFDPFAQLGPVNYWRYTYLYPCTSSRQADDAGTDADQRAAFQATRVGLHGFQVEISQEASLDFRVFDVTGRLVSERTLHRLQPGGHTFFWARQDRRGLPVAPGVYFGLLSDDARQVPLRFVVPY